MVNRQKSDLCIGIFFKPPQRAGECLFFLVGECSGTTCQLLPLVCIRKGNRTTTSIFKISFPLTFQSSLDVLAGLRSVAERSKPTGIAVHSMCMKFVQSADIDSAAPASSSHHVAGPAFESVEEQRIMWVKYRKDYTKQGPSLSEQVTAANVPTTAPLPPSPLALGDDLGSDESDDDDSDVERLEQELQGVDVTEDTTGDTEHEHDDENEEELLQSDELKDMNELQESMDRLVGAALDRQFNQSDNDHADDEATSETRTMDLSRPYEDEDGEAVLEKFTQSSPDGLGGGSAPSQPPKRQRRLQPEVTLSTSAVTQALMKWSRHVKLSGEACAELATSCSRFDLTNIPGSLSPNISLVLHEHDDELKVSLITWTSTNRKLSGRPITLDSDNRVIYPSHFTVPKLEFSSLVFLLSDIGARVRKQNRELVQDKVLRLQTMFESAIDALCSPSLALVGSDCVCAGCNQNIEGLELQRCSFCLLHWHSSCAMQGNRRLNNFLATHSVVPLCDLDLTPETMPFIFWYGAQRESASQSSMTSGHLFFGCLLNLL